MFDSGKKMEPYGGSGRIFKKKTVNFLSSLIIVSITLIFWVFMIELFLMFFFPQGSPLWGYDPVIGIKFAPNQCSEYISEEFNTRLCTNSEGFRDIEHELTKKESTIRIAILGDSMVAAREVNTENRFTELSNKLLEKKCNKNIEVFNFGVPGQGTAGQLLTFKHYVKKYKPDYTILFIHPNDVANNYLPLENRNYIPTYRLNDSGELGYVPFSKAPLISNKFLAFIAREMFPNVLTLAGKNFRYLSRVFKGKEEGIPKELYIYSIEESNDYKIAWKIEKKLLEELKEDVNAAGSKLIVFLWFSKDQAYNFSDYPESPAIKTFDTYRPNKKLNNLLEELDLTYFDLLNDIDLETQSYRNLFFELDGHLSEKGNEFVANLIFDHLVNETDICKGGR